MSNWLKIENNSVIFNDINMMNCEGIEINWVKLIEDCNQFINDVVDGGNVVDLTPNEGLGFHIDIWSDKRYDDLKDSTTFWFENYLND